MYSTPAGYRDAIESADRHVSIFVAIGVNIDSTAVDDITSWTVDSLPMSNVAQLYDASYELTHELATYEGYGIPTAVSAGMIAPPLSPKSFPPEVGVWSEEICDADGDISFALTVNLSQEHTSAMTIFTDGPNILAGEVVYTDDEENSVTVPLVAHDGYAVARGVQTYSSFTINITKIDGAYQHLRIVEIEFGESITLTMDRLGGEVTFIDEIDILQKGLPLSELDMELVNVLGEYDEDKPDSLYSQVAIGNPVLLSFTVEEGDTRVTIPLTRMVIGERRAMGDRLAVTAYDVRWNLSQTYTAWALSPSTSLGSTLIGLFNTIGVACIIDESLDEVYPVSAYSFTEESTVLDDLSKVAQAYGLVILPTHMGSISVSTAWNDDQYGDVPVDNLFTFPGSSQLNRYNYIDIRYGVGSYSRYTKDLRSDPNIAKSILSINNDLIISEAMAITLCNRLESQIYASAVEVDWRGDPAMELGDNLGIYTRWTQNSTPASYRAVKRVITYDGAFRETTTFIQQ